MQFCMMSYTMWRQGDFDVKHMLELTRELGMDAVDVVTLSGYEPEELRRMFDDYELKVACHTLMADLNHADEAARQPGVDLVKQGIADAVTLGTDKIMVVTGGKEGAPREESRRNYLAGLSAAADTAVQAGITMTVENFPGATSPFVTADDFLAALEEIPTLRLTFDSGNTLQGEDPAESFHRCAPHVVHSHFKDWTVVEPGEGARGLDGRWYRGALIGEGIVDHKSVLRAMKSHGYQDYIDLEYEGDKYTPEEAVRRALDYLRGLVAELDADK